MQDADAIVIGTGMGGLTTALCLARAGQKVLMLEQHYVPGGWCHSFLKDGYKFSPGVHFVGHLQENGNGREIFEGLGVANDMVFFQQNAQGYDYNIVGNQQFKMPAGMDALSEKLQQRFPKERRGIKKYIKLSQQIYDELFIALELFQMNWLQKLTLPYHTRHIGRMGWWKLNAVLNLYLKDPHLKTFLTLQCGNYGLPPKLAPFVIHSVVTNHCMSGTYYPRGGGSAMVKAFTKNIKGYGGSVQTGMGVKKILIEGSGSQRKAIGVQLENGKTLRSNIVISNADPHKTFLGMIGEQHISQSLRKKLKGTQYSIAALNLFLVVEMDLREAGMDSGNIWYAKEPNLDKAFDKFLNPDLLAEPEFPALFITSPTLKDPVSFDGHRHTLEVITFVPFDCFRKYEHSNYGERSPEYEKFKEQIIQKMLKTMENVLPGVSKKVVLKELGTPVTSNHYVETTEGNCYGPAKTMNQIGPFNYRAKSEIENLYLCGAATLSHGIVGTANSGINTAANILGCEKHDLLIDDPSQHLRTYDAESDKNWPKWLKDKGIVKRRRGQAKSLNRI